MYRQNYDRGIRPPSTSQPTRFKNDPVHRAGQEIDREAFNQAMALMAERSEPICWLTPRV